MIFKNHPEIFRTRVQVGFVSAVIVFAAAILYFATPGESGLFPPCPFHAITGMHCPGCGTLRGLHQLLHGNLIGAMDLNPLMVLCLPYLAYAYLSLWSKAIREKPLPGKLIPAKLLWSFVVVIIAFTILRNLPVYPFTILAP